MSSRSEREWQAAMGAVQNFGSVLHSQMEKRKKDEIARELAARVYPDKNIRSAEELAMQIKLDEAMDQRKYRQALTEKAERQPVARTSARPEIGEDGLTPYQRMQLEISRSREERLSNPAPRPKVEDFARINKEVEAATGYPLAKWNSAENKRTDAQGNFVADIDDEPVTVPRRQYEQFVGRVRKLEGGEQGGDVDPNASAMATTTQPEAAPSKPLDQATARAILAEVGGDKNKARDLARQRGYTF